MRLVNRDRIVRTNHQALVGVDGNLSLRHIGNVGNQVLRTERTLGNALLGARICEGNVGVVLETAVGKQRIAAPYLAVYKPLEFRLRTRFRNLSRKRIETLVALGDEERIAHTLARVVDCEFGGRNLFDGHDNAVTAVALLGRGRDIDIVGGDAVNRLAQRLVSVHTRVATDKAAGASRIFLAFAPFVGGIDVRTGVETDFAALAENGVGHLGNERFRRQQYAVVAEATVTVGTVNEVVNRVERTYRDDAVGIAHGHHAVGRSRNRIAIDEAGTLAYLTGFVRVGFLNAVETVEPSIVNGIGGHDFHFFAEAERGVATRRNNLDFRQVNRRRNGVGQRQVRGDAVDGGRQTRPNRIAGFKVSRGEPQAVGRNELVDNGVDAYRFRLGNGRIEYPVVGYLVGLGLNRHAVYIPNNRRLATAVEHRINLEREDGTDTGFHRVDADVNARFERLGRINGKDRRGVGTAIVGLADDAVEGRILDRRGHIFKARGRQIKPRVSLGRILGGLPLVRIHIVIRYLVGAYRIEANIGFAQDFANERVFINIDDLGVARIGTTIAEYQTAEITRAADFAGNRVSRIGVVARRIDERVAFLFLPQVGERTVAALGHGITHDFNIFHFGAERLTRGRNEVVEIIVRADRNRVGGLEVADAVGHLRTDVAVRAVGGAGQYRFRSLRQSGRGGERGPIHTVGGVFPIGARTLITAQQHRGRGIGAKRGVVRADRTYLRDGVYPQAAREP